MSFEIDLTGVETGKEVKTFKRVEPGVHTLTISKLELVTSGTGSHGVKITFDSLEADASFTETFWTSPKALPRIQYLLKEFYGEKGDGKLNLDILTAKLLGKTRKCIVDGREALSNPKTQEDGTVVVYTNVYPQLRFANFIGDNFTNADAIIQKLESSTGVDNPNKFADLPVDSLPQTSVPEDAPF